MSALLSVAATFDFTVVMVDVSQALLQSDLAHPTERLIVILPEWIPLPWSGTILGPDAPARPPPVTRGLLTTRPLYGGRDAPLRWFLKISSAFRKKGWKQLRTDVCVFGRYSHAGNLVGLAVVHVDDVLCAAKEVFWGEFRDIMAQYNTG